jgi:uncharacterized protein (DUF2236 family)
MAGSSAPAVTTPGDEHDPQIRALVEDSLTGIGMAAAGANVIMQLSQLAVGHGVASSRVGSGRVDQHPVKRTRTTLAYIAIALTGSDDERDAMRREVNRQHRQVRSGPDDPVAYDAMDPGMQLWVAACLYKGVEDIQAVRGIEHDDDTGARLYRYCARLGTTLQVESSQWPATRAAFQEYWDANVATIEMDGLTRTYLRGIARAEFLPAPLPRLVGPIVELQTMGFLAPEFRDELGLAWDARRQRTFDVMMRTWAWVDRRVPAVVRKFPFNMYRWDTQRRIRRGRPIV